MWQPEESFFNAPFIEVAKVVTAFTVAHSITLSLAALGHRLAAVALVGIRDSAVGRAGSAQQCVPGSCARALDRPAFAFGLLHGFGFAGALQDLGLPAGSLALSLAGFNIGVELGQLAIVAAFLPLAFALRATWSYRRVVLGGGSLAIASIAGVWLVERAFDVKWLAM